jgi:uncharacterized protein
MTPEERDMLSELAAKIAQTPAPAHDPEADEFIRTNIGKRPDALYILTQTTLIQNLAIQHAQQEIQELKQRLAQPAGAQPTSSFLGTGATPGASRPAGMPGSTSPWPASSPTPPPIPQSAPPAPEAPSFLRSAAQTAAGVAAGAFAFEGIRALFGGGGFGGWGGPHFGGLGGGSFLGGTPGGETVINNYYDTPDADKDASGRPDDDRNTDAAATDDVDASGEDTSDSGDTYADDSYDDGGGSGGDELV